MDPAFPAAAGSADERLVGLLEDVGCLAWMVRRKQLLKSSKLRQSGLWVKSVLFGYLFGDEAYRAFDI